MALLNLRNTRKNEKADTIDAFASDLKGQIAEFARVIYKLRGKPKKPADDADAKRAKQDLFDRSNDWANELTILLNAGVTTIQESYYDLVEGDESTEVAPDVKKLVDDHGAEAVAASLVTYADDDGRIGSDYRVLGKGVQRQKKKQRRKPPPRRRGS